MLDWAPLSTIPEFGGTPPPPLSDDPGPFLRIGTTFYLGRQEWVGRSIVSPHAVYLLKGRSLDGMSVGHSAAIALIKTAKALLAQNYRPDIRTCRVCELPANVRAELDPKGKKGLEAAVVVRSADAIFVKVPRIYNVITFDLATLRVRVVTSWFGVRKVGRWLAQHGWVVNQPLQSTEETSSG